MIIFSASDSFTAMALYKSIYLLTLRRTHSELCPIKQVYRRRHEQASPAEPPTNTAFGKLERHSVERIYLRQ